MQTVMANEPLRRAMVRQADRAVRAGRDVAALGTLDERGVSASIEQQNTLLALLETIAERRLELIAHDEAQPVARVTIGGPGWREVGSQQRRPNRNARRRRLRQPAIDHLHLRQLRLPDTVGQREQRVFAALRVDPTFQTRRRTPEYDDGSFRARTNDRHLARVVARRLTLLVARLVFLIDDDGAEVGERSEDRGARANRDPFAALLEREPFVVSLAVAQRAVQHGDLFAKHGAEAVDRLRSERNLRYEDDRRLPFLDDDAP